MCWEQGEKWASEISQPINLVGDNWISWHPGSRSKSCKIGVHQMVTDSWDSGGAGCSMAATPPVQKSFTIPSSMKPMRSLPALSCRNSRKLRECRPHGSAGRRRTRGATRFSSMPCSLAFDQVSHGGPPRSATTNRLRMASIQKARVFGQVMSPQVLSMTTSKEITQSWTPGWSPAILSKKCWKSPNLLHPEKVCRMYRILPNPRRGVWASSEGRSLAASN